MHERSSVEIYWTVRLEHTTVMSWYGQRARPGELRRETERQLQRLSAGDVCTTHDVLHRLIDITPVDDSHAVQRGLVQMLAHPAMEDGSRQAIATAIERLFKRHDTVFDGLVDFLAHIDSRIRNCASDLLSRLVTTEQHAACVHAIAGRLNDVSDTTRASVIRCLHDIVVNTEGLHRLCVAALCQQLKSPKSCARSSAIDGLVTLAHLGQRDDLIAQVVGCLQDPGDTVRKSAVRAVRALVDAAPRSFKDWIVAAAACMDHEDEPVRTTGREALALLSSGSIVRPAGEATGSKARRASVWDLGYGREGQPCIAQDHLLQKPLRRKGVDAKSSNSRATVAHIGVRLEDPNPLVRQSAVASLCALRDAGEHDRIDLIRCSALRLDYDDDDVRSTAVEALGHLVRGDEEEEVGVILEWLERASSDGHDSNTRVYAVKAAGKVARYNDERVVKALLQATNDPDYRVCREALRVLDHVAHFGR